MASEEVLTLKDYLKLKERDNLIGLSFSEAISYARDILEELIRWSEAKNVVFGIDFSPDNIRIYRGKAVFLSVERFEEWKKNNKVKEFEEIRKLEETVAPELRNFWENNTDIQENQILDKIIEGPMQVFSLGFLILHMLHPEITKMITLLNLSSQELMQTVGLIKERKKPPCDFVLILKSMLSHHPDTRPTFYELQEYFINCMEKYQIIEPEEESEPKRRKQSKTKDSKNEINEIEKKGFWKDLEPDLKLIENFDEISKFSLKIEDWKYFFLMKLLEEKVKYINRPDDIWGRNLIGGKIINYLQKFQNLKSLTLSLTGISCEHVALIESVITNNSTLEELYLK